MPRISFFIVTVLFLTGCTVYSLVPKGQSKIDGTYTVNTEILWSKATEGHQEIWTVDGPALQKITFINGITDGDTLFEIAPGAQTQGKPPEYKSDMSYLEIMEFIETSATANGIVGMAPRNFRPYKFGSLDGFRAEFSFTTEDGLLREGFGVGAKKDKKLYIIFYSGAKIHYFPKYKDDVEYILRSIKIL